MNKLTEFLTNASFGDRASAWNDIPTNVIIHLVLGIEVMHAISFIGDPLFFGVMRNYNGYALNTAGENFMTDFIRKWFNTKSSQLVFSWNDTGKLVDVTVNNIKEKEDATGLTFNTIQSVVWNVVTEAWLALSETANLEDLLKPYRPEGNVRLDDMAASKFNFLTAEIETKTLTLYHTTKRENVESILANGFQLSKIAPRWVNDYAVSCMHTLKNATNYFTNPGKPFNTEKYAVLQLKFRGNVAGEYDQRDSHFGESPQEYTKRIIDEGIDAYDGGGVVFIYNPSKIYQITEINVR
jgi:hypothetical protein